MQFHVSIYISLRFDINFIIMLFL